MTTRFKVSVVVVFLFLLGLAGCMMSCAENTKKTHPAITSESIVNMSLEDLAYIRDIEILNMISDTAKAYNIKPHVLCGLAYHESGKFSYAKKKIKDSNGKFSYGLFMIQLETAILYDKTATEEKLLTPAYNAHVASLIFQSNLKKYKTYEMAIAAHNAGTIFNGKVTNGEFVKKVYFAIGEVASKYNLPAVN